MNRQVYLYMVDEAPDKRTCFPFEAFCAVLRNSDIPGSLVGSVSADERGLPTARPGSEHACLEKPTRAEVEARLQETLSRYSSGTAR